MAKFLKKLLTRELKQLALDAESCVLVDFRGLNAKESDDLRQRLREKGVRMNVIPNRLYRRALAADFMASAGEGDVTGMLRGPTAVVFGSDGALTAAKILLDWRKEHRALEIKGGFLDQKVIGRTRVEELARLPSREVLVGHIVGLIAGPVLGIVNVLDSAARSLVCALDAIAKKNEGARNTSS